MSKQDDNEPQEPTEVTPGGLEVRTPSREEFLNNLRRVSRPEPESESKPDA